MTSIGVGRVFGRQLIMGLFFTPLDLVLSSPAKVRLLRALQSTRAPLSGREAAEAAGISLRPAQRALADLVAAGVVRRDDTRSQHLYTLRRENEVVQRCILPLFQAEHERTDRVFRDLRRGLRRADGSSACVDGLYLFGSAARGKDGVRSDFDVLAVAATPGEVDAVHEKLAEFAPEVYTRHGLRLSVVVIDRERLRAMHAADDPLTRELLRDNRRITGERLERLIDGGTGKPKGSG